MLNLQYIIPSDDPSNGLLVAYRADVAGRMVGEVIDYSRYRRGDATAEKPVLAVVYSTSASRLSREWHSTVEAARRWLYMQVGG